MYGKHNRFDHNYLAGKLNAGVTMAVYLNDVKNQDNHNRVDHNYFGERKRLGSNGGETLRVGTSTYSLVPANVTIEDNFFEKCNGEVEALSIKATGCTIRGNVFFETEGCLALRHGNNNEVYENLFIGNGKPSTSGLRVINAGHNVHDNYFFKLTGERFRSALGVMNGVPNSAINRYHQVKDVNIHNNTFIDCNWVEFGVGSDNERTATPINSSFKNNTIYQTGNFPPVSFIDDVSGVTFAENHFYAANSDFKHEGFVSEEMQLKMEKSGLYLPKKGKNKEAGQTGNINADDLVQKQNAGPDWFKSYKPEAKTPAKKISVSNKSGALEQAVQDAAYGDTIVLVSEGTYTLSQVMEVDKLLYVLADENLEEQPQLIFDDARSSRDAQFLLVNGGNLYVKGLAFNGTTDAGNKAARAIATSDKGMITPYWLTAEECTFFNFNESSYNAFRSEKGSFADSLTFRNCLFHTTSGDAISIAAEKEDRGIYNAEYVTIENCIFYNIMGAALDLYRGGNDESTLGPYLDVNHCLFENVNNKELGSVLRLMGVQNAKVSNSIFSNSGQGGRSIKFEETRWDHCMVTNCSLFNSGRIESFYNNVTIGEVYNIEPVYKDKSNFDFRLKNQSEFNKETTIGLIY
jgi:poly(beta-D-mannuronate) lyase